MLATDKQIQYLIALANKVEQYREKCPTQLANFSYIDWNKERYMGVTMTDANIRIKAYKSLICNLNFTIKLLGV